LLSSVIFGIKHAVPHMEARGGGSIINCSSIAGIRYNQGNILYSVLKAAVTHYTRLAAVELGPKQIRVNAISPGAIATPIFWGGSARANTLAADDNARKLEKLKANLARATPLPRAGLADDIAEAALYLASDAGSYVNGHDLVVDGGRTQLFRE
jgi:NAD(P)-dependent dehydrogenase (short-subunit alcohol dehydrogenase family)